VSNLRVSLSSVQINDGSSVQLPAEGIIMVVGPNNSGKTRFLKDVGTLISGSPGGVVIKRIETNKIGSTEELWEYLRSKGAISNDQGGVERLIGNSGASRHSYDSVSSWWNSSDLPLLDDVLVLQAATENRLLTSRAARAMNFFDSAPSEPLHFLYNDPSIESQLDQISRAAFGMGVFLDRFTGGSHWALRIGDFPGKQLSRLTAEQHSLVQSLPKLEDQGDGVRSLLGLMLLWLVGAHQIALLDEPEAFLHPPQSKFLAQLLSKESNNSHRQVILATHSSDIVRGALDTPAGVTILRIARDGDVNSVSKLSSSDVKRLWSDPLLRYSNLLEGLFSDAVWVCESDGDCRYYSAIVDSLDAGISEAMLERRPDVLFTHCNGKHRLHVVVEAMRAASVPVYTITDFDILREEETIAHLVEAFGVEFNDDLKRDRKTVDDALKGRRNRASMGYVKEAVEKIFADFSGAYFESEHEKRIRGEIKVESGWDLAKQVGVSLLSGSSHEAATRLIGRLAEIGIFLVQEGEVESFVPSVGGHGGTWVAGVLEQGKHLSPESDGARGFVSKILGRMEAG